MFLHTLIAAIRYGTRIGGPAKPSPELMRGALLLQPLVGFGIGLFAAIPVLFICGFCSALQGFLLFSSVIYLVLSEWITRFHGLYEFSRVTGALKTYGVSLEERLALLENPPENPAGDGVCSMLCIVAKTVLLYLFVLRLGLFGTIFPLAVVLVMVPALSRAVMLFACPGPEYAAKHGMESGASIPMWAKLLSVLFWYILIAVVFALVNLLGVHVFSLSSMGMNLDNLRMISDVLRSSPETPVRFTVYFIQALLLLFPGIFLPIYYWKNEAVKKCGRMTHAMLEPLRQTAEVVLFTMCLICIDIICF